VLLGDSGHLEFTVKQTGLGRPSRPNLPAILRSVSGANRGLPEEICNHTFRDTGITAYLENGGTIEDVQPEHPSGAGLSGLRRCGYYFSLRAVGAG
jgi:hypothetical protein